MNTVIFTHAPLVAAAAAVLLSVAPAVAQRAKGTDVSSNQGTLSLSNWSTLRNTDGIEFAFIRSSRGGTTSALGQVFDSQFNNNMYRATQAGVLAGAYHFSRPDLNPSAAGGVNNAQQFLNAARPWMRGGFLRPVLDLEDGDIETTPAQLTAWAIAFADTIQAEIGVYPIFYSNSNYVTNELAASDGAGNTLMSRVPDLWLARPAGGTNSQTGQPPTPSGYANPYGRWAAQSPPWKFWQYGLDQPAGTLKGISTAVDLDVANGDIEFVKDFLIPAIWQTDTDGAWTSTANWNLGAVVVGSTTYFPARLPDANDTVVLNRSAANPLITLASGQQTIRRLQALDRLAITGGSLTVLKNADFSSALTIAGAGALSAATATFNGGASLNFSGGGTLTAPSIALNANVAMTGSGAASIKAPTGQTGSLALGSTNRTFDIATGGALAISLSISSSVGSSATALTKTGAGDLVLSVANGYAGVTSLAGGRVIVESDGALGGVSGYTIFSPGGAASLAFRAPAGASGFQYNAAETIKTDGIGAPGSSQIDNLGGDNRFGGTVVLSGPAGTVRTASVGVSAGSLELAGPIYAGGAGSTIVNKTGAGNLILSGNSTAAPTYPGAAPLAGAAVNVNAGTVTFRGLYASNSLPGVTTWNVSPGATLTVDSGRFESPSIVVAPSARLVQHDGGIIAGTITGGGDLSISDQSYFTGGNVQVGRLDVGAVTASNAQVVLYATSPVASRVTSLALSGNITFDLNNSALVVDYSGENPLAYLRGKVLNAYNNGTWSVFSLTSQLLTLSELRGAVGMGYADNALLGYSDWLGVQVDPTAVLLRPTWYGDANLDGAIDSADYARLAAGLQLAPGSSTWATGDFNYDGTTNADDYALYAIGLTHQSGSLTYVPEPSAALLALLPLLCRPSRSRGRRRVQ